MKSIGVVLCFLNFAVVASPHFVPYRVLPLERNSTRVQHRIHGGLVPDYSQFPFMIFALMKVEGGISKCSSSLISQKWVLMAAHCLTFPNLRPRDILLVGGKSDLGDYISERILSQHPNFYETVDGSVWNVQERRANKFFIHPNYSSITIEHDVGLVQLKESFSWALIEPIPISLGKIKSKMRCTILGWGLVKGNFDLNLLHFVENKLISTTEIGCAYKKTGAFVCLEQGAGGICMGDSGSPLVCDGKVWGVASHYYTTSEISDCGDSLEEYYTELYDDLPWIKSVYGGGSSSVGTNAGTLLLCLVSSLLLAPEKKWKMWFEL